MESLGHSSLIFPSSELNLLSFKGFGYLPTAYRKPFCLLPLDFVAFVSFRHMFCSIGLIRKINFNNCFPGETGSREWCKLAYWELATRVGRQFSVEPESVNVFTCLPHGDGLCLATLAQTAPEPPPDTVRRTRLKIGLGKSLWKKTKKR